MISFHLFALNWQAHLLGLKGETTFVWCHQHKQQHQQQQQQKYKRKIFPHKKFNFLYFPFYGTGWNAGFSSYSPVATVTTTITAFPLIHSCQKALHSHFAPCHIHRHSLWKIKKKTKRNVCILSYFRVEFFFCKSWWCEG